MGLILLKSWLDKIQGTKSQDGAVPAARPPLGLSWQTAVKGSRKGKGDSREESQGFPLRTVRGDEELHHRAGVLDSDSCPLLTEEA